MRLQVKSIARATDQECVERRTYDKPIRDRIPEQMVTDGVRYRVDLLDDGALLSALPEKLVAEAGDVLAAEGRSER